MTPFFKLVEGTFFCSTVYGEEGVRGYQPPKGGTRSPQERPIYGDRRGGVCSFLMYASLLELVTVYHFQKTITDLLEKVAFGKRASTRRG